MTKITKIGVVKFEVKHWLDSYANNYKQLN